MTSFSPSAPDDATLVRDALRFYAVDCDAKAHYERVMGRTATSIVLGILAERARALASQKTAPGAKATLTLPPKAAAANRG